jgi:hypothetical protein
MERQAGASGRSANRPSAIDLIAAVMTCKAVVILGPLARASLHRRIISPRANTRCVNVGRNIRAVAGPFEDQYARRERLGHNTSAAELGADEVAESNLVSFRSDATKRPVSDPPRMDNACGKASVPIRKECATKSSLPRKRTDQSWHLG